jgi:tetratricopeptide (TPR) repeat protein
MTPQHWREIEQIYQAALEREGEERVLFLDAACGGDAGLREEVESLLEAQASTGGFLESPAMEVASQILVKQGSYRRFGPYRVIREAGHGGMGTVYLAERDDGQYSRKVAIKVVNGIGSEELMQHFRREREILAALDHPHIARLEDAGLHDGTPYLVMELVEGQPLNQYCEEHRLSTAARCRLFITICRAVEHAHRHLVIHRDLKPSNILVTAEGTPKLLDFGIAKLLVSEQTAAGPLSFVLALTPAYASPEQMLGKHLATASDIYSLGVLLYELLVGRRPFDFSGASLAQAAETAGSRSPEKPSVASGKRELEGDLDAIVLHAMAGEADERYGSAEELAADLERHLARRPVKAQPRGWRYVALKFLSRHRRVAWASAAAFLAFAGVFAAALVERHTALREREAATRRFNHVRKLAHAIINEFDERAAAVPGNLELRKLMVARSSEYLNLLAREDLSGDPGLLRELADSFIKLGDIVGNSSISNLGDAKGALADYEQARKLFERLIQRNPADLEPRLALGRLLLTISTVLQNSGQLPESKRSRLDGYRHWEALRGQFPQEARVVVGFADACFGMAQRAESSRLMITYYNRALEIYEALARQHPQEDKYQRNMALAHKYLAGIKCLVGGICG